jgi:hypothetical protein
MNGLPLINSRSGVTTSGNSMSTADRPLRPKLCMYDGLVTIPDLPTS